MLEHVDHGFAIAANLILVVGTLIAGVAGWLRLSWKVDHLEESKAEAKKQADEKVTEAKRQLDRDIADAKADADKRVTEAVKRAEDAHLRINVMAEAMHMFREEVAGKYVDKTSVRDSMRELENRVSADIENLSRTVVASISELTKRIDQLISARSPRS